MRYKVTEVLDENSAEKIVDWESVSTDKGIETALRLRVGQIVDGKRFAYAQMLGLIKMEVIKRRGINGQN